MLALKNEKRTYNIWVIIDGVAMVGAQVLLYMARAYYDCNQIGEAKRCLLRAVHLAPSDWKLRFNVAFCLQASAMCAVHGRGRYDIQTQPHLQQKTCMLLLLPDHRSLCP